MKAGRKLALNMSTRQILAAFFLLAGVLFASFLFGTPKVSAAQTVPYKINFQGRLTNSSGNAMADGSYNMKFRLYSVDTGGSPVWTETRETTNRVTVSNGLFSVQLGDVTALSPSVFTSYPLYFEIELPTTGTATCSTASCATFNGTEVMTPRRALGATPYAMNADTLDGIDATTFARQDQSNTFTAGQLIRTGSASALQVQNASNNEVLTVDTSANKVILGKASTLAGSLVFANATNANLVTINSGVTTGSGYALTLPVALGSTNDCLKDTGSGILGFAACATTDTNTTYTPGNDLDMTGTTFDIESQLDFVSVISRASSTLTLQTTTSGNIILNSAATIELQDDTNVTGALSITGNVSQTGVTTFGTGTGAVSLNGNTTVASGKTFSALGTAQFKSSANATNAFGIQNAGGTNLVNVDSIGLSTNMLTNASFESSLTGNWVARNTATPVQDTTMFVNGINSVKIPATAANDGTKQNVALSSATTYTMTLYARGSLDFKTFEFGRSENGSADTSCQTAVTVIKFGWTRLSCTFTTGTVSGTTYVYAKQTDAVSRSIFIDSVTLETEANYSGGYRDSKIELNGTVTTGLTLQPANNTSTALQVLSSSGASIFNIDNTDANMLAGFAGFENHITGWSYTTTGGSVTRDMSNAYSGSYSLKVVTAATANNGALLNLNNSSTNSPMAVVATSAPYVISWYAKNSGAAFTDITALYSPDGSATTACTTINTQTVTASGWTRFICTLTTSATAQTTASYISIIQTAATAHTFYIDSVQMEAGSAASAYGAGSISFNAAITTPAMFQNKENSVNAFSVQSNTGTSILSVDTLNTKVVVGSATSDTTAVVFQLDSSNNFIIGEPTCGTTTNQGGLYYNASSQSMRGCIGGQWEDMPSTSGLGIYLFGVVPDSGSNPGDLPALGTTGVTGPCKVSWNSATQLAVAACTAYSGGRKVIVPAQTINTNTALGVSTSNIWANLCLTGTNNQPVFGGAPTTTELASSLPTLSINNPILCLATIKFSSTVSGNIAQIYDTRTFTNSMKEFMTMSSAATIGQLVCSATFHGAPCASATAPNVHGVVVATSSTTTTSTTAPNAIIATAGPAYVKAISGTAGNFVTGSATAGYASAGAATAQLYNLGISRTTGVATCTSAATCLGSLFVDLKAK
jgi:hypothetical protein